MTIMFCHIQVYELDLSTVVPCCSGPKRPHDLVSLLDMKSDFTQCLSSKLGFKVSLIIFTLLFHSLDTTNLNGLLRAFEKFKKSLTEKLTNLCLAVESSGQI